MRLILFSGYLIVVRLLRSGGGASRSGDAAADEEPFFGSILASNPAGKRRSKGARVFLGRLFLLEMGDFQFDTSQFK